MGNRNDLVLWEENGEKKWNMIKEEDNNTFLINLLQNNGVNKHTIFVIPTSGFVSAIWLWTESHKSNRVDFLNFFSDYGEKYEKIIAKEENKKTLHELHEKNSDATKYGWISPNGTYYHCGYQGHIDLSNRICFGLIETDNSELYLEEHGWCKIYKSLFDENYSVYVGEKHCITSVQMKTLIELELDNAKDLSKMLVSR